MGGQELWVTCGHSGTAVPAFTCAVEWEGEWLVLALPALLCRCSVLWQLAWRVPVSSNRSVVRFVARLSGQPFF